MNAVWNFATFIVDAATNLLKNVIGLILYPVAWLFEFVGRWMWNQFTQSGDLGKFLWFSLFVICIFAAFLICVRTFYIPLMLIVALPIAYFLARVIVIVLMLFSILILYQFVKYKIRVRKQPGALPFKQKTP